LITPSVSRCGRIWTTCHALSRIRVWTDPFGDRPGDPRLVHDAACGLASRPCRCVTPHAVSWPA
jgi:hypothetical protein